MMNATRKMFRKVFQINGRRHPSRFSNLLLALAGLAGSVLLILTASWDQVGPVVVVAFIAGLGFSELVADLPGVGFKQAKLWLDRANLPLFILCACTLVYKVVAILTMPEN